MKRTQFYQGIPTLGTALMEHMNADALRKLAALTKERLPSRKAELAAVILRHLEGSGLRTVWEGLDKLQQAAVAEVVHSDSTTFPSVRFQAKYGREPNWGTSARYGWRMDPSALGFFFYGDRIMPDDLKARLLEFVPRPAEVRIQVFETLPDACDVPYSEWNPQTRTQERGTRKVPLTVHETERRAQRELLSVLRLVDSGRVSVSDKTRRPSAATVAAVTSVLEGGDTYPPLPVANKRRDENPGAIRAFAWPMLVQAGGLAQMSGTKLRLTRAGRKALAEPAVSTIRTLGSRWLGTTVLDELSRIECVKGQGGKGKRGLTAISLRRGAIVDTLAECPVGGWVSTEGFLRFMRASGNDFSVAHNAWHLYICELRYGSLGYEGGERILVERYVLAFLLEYAATLGFIDVALIPPAGARTDYHSLWGTDDLVFFSRYDGLMYLRLTPLGAYCLGSEATYEPTPLAVRPVLQVLPNLEIAAVGAELEQWDRLALDTYATRVSDLVWRLDAGKLLAAMEEGRPIDEIREFLSARSGNEIPGTVSRLLEDVAARSAKVQDRGLARLVECADAALAALIANDPRTGKHCMRAGERHLAVFAPAEAAFKRSLRELGYLVAGGGTRPAGTRGKSSPIRKAAPAAEA